MAPSRSRATTRRPCRRTTGSVTTASSSAELGQVEQARGRARRQPVEDDRRRRRRAQCARSRAARRRPASRRPPGAPAGSASETPEPPQQAPSYDAARGHLVGQVAAPAGQVGRPSAGGSAPVERRRGGVDDLDPPQRAAARVTQDGPVAVSKGKGRLEPEPGMRVAEGAGVHGHVSRSQVEQGPVGEGPVAADPDVDPGHRLEGSGGDQHGPSAQASGHGGRQPQRDPGHARHRRARSTQRLDAADSHHLVAEGQPVADPDRAGGEGPGDDRARAADVERPVDPQPYVGGRVGRRHRGEDVGQRCPQVVETRTGASADHHGRGAGERRAVGLGAGPGQCRRRVRQVGPGDRHQSV